jgi:hypothetical protein
VVGREAERDPHKYVKLCLRWVAREKEAMLTTVFIVIITVVLLIGMDRVSGQQTTDGRIRIVTDDGILNRFLHRRSQLRHRQPKPCIPTGSRG